MNIIVLLIHLSGGVDKLVIPADVCPVVAGPELMQIVAHSSLYEAGDKIRSHCEVKQADGRL